MEIKRIEGEIEAILFAMGEAVELPRIARAIRQDQIGRASCRERV